MGVFRVKNRDFTQKNHIFSNFRGGTCRVHPPLDPPLIIITTTAAHLLKIYLVSLMYLILQLKATIT